MCVLRVFYWNFLVMKKIFIVLASVLLILPMMGKVCEATHKLDDYMPDRGYGPMSRENLGRIKDEYDTLQAQNQRLLAHNQALAMQNANLFDLLSTQQKEFIALSIVTGAVGFLTGYYFGYDAGYEMGYSAGLGAAVPTLCEVAKPIIRTVYKNVTEYIPFYRNVTEYVPCNATKTVYLQPDHLILNAQPFVTVRRSLIGSLWSKFTG